jgi:hypothetical protein
MKPCASHIVAVVAAALAMWGRANTLAANSPAEPRKTERRVVVFIRVFLPRWHRPSAAGAPEFSLRGDILRELGGVLNRYRNRRACSMVIASDQDIRAVKSV